MVQEALIVSKYYFFSRHHNLMSRGRFNLKQKT